MAVLHNLYGTIMNLNILPVNVVINDMIMSGHNFKTCQKKKKINWLNKSWAWVRETYFPNHIIYKNKVTYF